MVELSGIEPLTSAVRLREIGVSLGVTTEGIVSLKAYNVPQNTTMFSVFFPYRIHAYHVDFAMADLSRVKDRERLKARREPHWQRLQPGCFLGYRVSGREGAGTWIARAYDDTERSYRLRALGSFADRPGNEQFALAKQEAEKFALEVERGCFTDEKLRTVEDACRRFADTHKDAGSRFSRFVYSEPIAKVRLSKLRRSHTRAWREQLEATPARVSRSKTGPPVTRPRSPASVNRDMATFRTALGQVLALGNPNTEAAWQEPLKPIKNAVKRRTLYLSRDQRKALLEATEMSAEPFVRTLCMLPLRPGAIAALTVGDFDKETNELTIGKDKSGIGRRIVVPAAAGAVFKKASKGNQPSAPLVQRSNGKAWSKETWKGPIANAAKAAGLPPGVTAYTLRHSTITDLVSAGLPLLTIAQISGTSAEMIERHYGHLGRHAATEALAGLAL